MICLFFISVLRHVNSYQELHGHSLDYTSKYSESTARQVRGINEFLAWMSRGKHEKNTSYTSPTKTEPSKRNM